MWNQVENANEQLPTKTPEEYIQDFAKIMKSPNYSFQQIDDLLKEIDNANQLPQIQLILQQRSTNTWDPEIPKLDQRICVIMNNLLEDYQKLKNITGNATSELSNSVQGETSEQRTNTDTITFSENEFDFTRIKLSWRKWSEPITKEQLMTTCKSENIPNEAKKTIKEFLQNANVKGLQQYLNGLLNPSVPITSGPKIDQLKFTLNLTNQPWINNTDNWHRLDEIKDDGYLGPQTLTAIASIENATAETAVVNTEDLSDEPPENIDEQPTENSEKIKTKITGILWDKIQQKNIEVDESKRLISLTFKERIEGEEKTNTLVYNYQKGEIAFKNGENLSKRTLQLDGLKINNMETILNNNDDKTLQCVAELSQLFSHTFNTKCKGWYSCKYNEEMNKINITSWSITPNALIKWTSTKTEPLFEDENNKDLLQEIQRNIGNTINFTDKESQKKIATFMTTGRTLIKDDSQVTTFLNNLPQVTQAYTKDNFEL